MDPEKDGTVLARFWQCWNSYGSQLESDWQRRLRAGNVKSLA
jgi:hypothetical protein